MRSKAVPFLLAMMCWLFLEGGTAGAANHAPTSGETSNPSTPLRLDGNGLGIVSFGASVAKTGTALIAVLGAPSGHPSAGCKGNYREDVWHDLIVNFKNGRFAGYRYVAGGVVGARPSKKSVDALASPALSTAAGITLGSTMARAKRGYPTLRASGTDFWKSASGIVFGFGTGSYPIPATAVISEIKDDVCPGSL